MLLALEFYIYGLAYRIPLFTPDPVPHGTLALGFSLDTILNSKRNATLLRLNTEPLKGHVGILRSLFRGREMSFRGLETKIPEFPHVPLGAPYFRGSVPNRLW